jgi:SagB-type dehydrogenase family enzyme
MKVIFSLVLALWFTLVNLTAGFGAEVVKLPPPAKKGTMSVEEALQGRRSTRRFADRALSLAQISQLLWAGDGINNPQGKRTAPSGRAAYPMDLYLVAGERGVTNLPPGIYHYLVAENALELVAKGEFRPAVAQAWIAKAPAIIVITGDYQRSEAKNGDKGPLYTHIEAGLICQDVFLQAGALGLGAGVAGGMNVKALGQALKIPPAHIPFLVMPVGYKF